MTYSFGVYGRTKDEAKAKIAQALDRVVARHPVHARDRELALAHGESVVDALADDSRWQVVVYMNGFIVMEGDHVVGLSVAAHAGLQPAAV